MIIQTPHFSSLDYNWQAVLENIYLFLIISSNVSLINLA